MNKYLIEYRLDGEKQLHNTTVLAIDLANAAAIGEKVIINNHIHPFSTCQFEIVSIGLLKYPDEELCADHDIPLVEFKEHKICTICQSSPIRGEE